MTAVENKLGIYCTKIKHNRPKYIVHTLLSGIGYVVTIHITDLLKFKLTTRTIHARTIHARWMHDTRTVHARYTIHARWAMSVTRRINAKWMMNDERTIHARCTMNDKYTIHARYTHARYTHVEWFIDDWTTNAFYTILKAILFRIVFKIDMHFH